MRPVFLAASCFNSIAQYSRLHDFPYRDNAVLHIYAAFMCIYLGQQHDEDEDDGENTVKKMVYDSASLRRAKLYLERALALDPENGSARELMAKVCYHALKSAGGADLTMTHRSAHLLCRMEAINWMSLRTIL